MCVGFPLSGDAPVGVFFFSLPFFAHPSPRGPNGPPFRLTRRVFSSPSMPLFDPFLGSCALLSLFGHGSCSPLSGSSLSFSLLAPVAIFPFALPFPFSSSCASSSPLLPLFLPFSLVSQWGRLRRIELAQWEQFRFGRRGRCVKILNSTPPRWPRQAK